MATIVVEALRPLEVELVAGDRGPGFVDQETSRLLIHRVNAGWLFVPASAEVALVELEQDDLDAQFAAELAASPLMSDDPFDHRVFALAIVLARLGNRFDQGVDPLTGAPKPLPRNLLTEAMRGTVEYKQQLGADLVAIGLSAGAAAELASLVPVTANRVESLTGLTAATLGVWRQRGQGPVFMAASAGPQKAGVRGRVVYPLGELLAWLYAQDRDS